MCGIEFNQTVFVPGEEGTCRPELCGSEEEEMLSCGYKWQQKHSDPSLLASVSLSVCNDAFADSDTEGLFLVSP